MNQSILGGQRESLGLTRYDPITEVSSNILSFTRGPVGFAASSPIIAAVASGVYIMTKQRIKPVEISFYGNKSSLIVLNSLRGNAIGSVREDAIKIIIKTHNINTASTTSLSYDPKLSDAGICSHSGKISIGQSAFRQDMSWLANVILHEVIHADQFKCYFGLGVMDKLKQASLSQIRQIKALDEFEAYYFCWQRKKTLGLTDKQIRDLLHRMRIVNVDIDNAKITSLVKKGLFEQARMLLLNAI